MRLKISESAASADSKPSLGARGLEAGELDHPHLDWVGRHYLAEDRMFRPGESVTPVGASDHPGGQRVTVATHGVRSPSVGKRAPRRAPVVLDSAPRQQEAVRGPKAVGGSRVGETFLSVTRNRTGAKGPGAWDYLRTDKLWVGCKVRMIWHMDQNGIQLTRKSASSWTEALGRGGAGSQAASRSRKAELPPRDTNGVVCNVVFKREAQAYEFHVKGDRTGRLYKVGLSKWHCGNWTVTTHPLACMLAMNTYDCQGCTITGDVIYHPPRHFLLSPIKPSVYVALSRVTSRDRIEMTNCNFAETVGEVRFYDDRLVAYRKRVEMGYSS
ncbi:hypothetical protein Q5P01_019993 [Channa striata]|uniref:Uncharacterized protein n=1 Tax=Channa striata TaxID=64152 RepID=A0AA88LXK3_CHASR|nr:hypothetical protein Q5P01_019993 [Channa striata]